MSNEVSIDREQVRRFAAELSAAAEDLRTLRPDFLARLANGAGERPTLKTQENVKVTMGLAPYQHSGSVAGEVIAARVKSCGDGFVAVEDGVRAIGAVMAEMLALLENDDEINAEELSGLVAELYSVQLVSEGESPESVDWFGLEAS